MAQPKTSSEQAPSGVEPVHDNVKGALWMVASGVFFTIYLAAAKSLTADYDTAIVAISRSFISIILALPFILVAWRSVFNFNRFPMLFARSAFGTLGFFLSIYALAPQFGLPLSQFSAISFSRTLFVVVLAALILREPVGWRRWAATAVGFLGVLVMIKPTAEGIGMGSLLALASAASFGGAIILVKSLSVTHTPLSIMTLANILSCLFLLPFALMNWQMPPAHDWWRFILMAACGATAQYCYIIAMKIGDASFQAPMDYLRLPMTTMADWVLTRVLPGISIWLGALIIVSSTLYITIREARLGRKRGTKSDAGP